MLCYILVGVTFLFQNVCFAVAESEECGTRYLEPQSLILGGVQTKRGEAPWHVAIYRKTTKPYQALCVGSLVTKDRIISVAHCFWSNEKRALPAAEFAAAAGKLHRPWAYNDDDAQKSDIKEIHLPLRFAGTEANLQDDISLLVVTQPFSFNKFVRPVCINFDSNLERQQLQAGNKGQIASWNSFDLKAVSLQTSELPYVDIVECIRSSKPSFREYITSDKFCTGTDKSNTTSLCRGDSGAGLAFPTVELGKERYYLRGVASVSDTDSNDSGCGASFIIFTQLSRHENFIKELLN